MSFRFRVFVAGDGTRFVVPGFGYNTGVGDRSPGWKIALGCFMMECVTYSNMEDDWLDCPINENGAIDIYHRPAIFPNRLMEEKPIHVLVIGGPGFKKEEDEKWAPNPLHFDFSVLTRRQ